MFSSGPGHLQDYLSHHGLIDDVYKAMRNPDYSETVVTVLDILRKTKQLPALVKEVKSEAKSTAFRNEGNRAYSANKYQSALMCYNKALLFAPNDSRALKLAYSNRSALLYKVKAFSDCMSDIETCFTIGCPVDIVDKLLKRKEEATGCLWMERLSEGSRFTTFSNEYFRFNVKRNPMIPCVSTDVEIVTEAGVPKVVATRDVKVGAVIAVETAFVSVTDVLNSDFSCYYCHKMNLTLHPCDNCCRALFCNDECRDKCFKEYHNIECQIIEVLDAMSSVSAFRLPIKAVLKMRYMCKSWEELISASYELGLNSMNNISINQIYDSNSKFSLLHIKNERHFLSGPLYNACFTCAKAIHYLETTTSFLPQSVEERTAAIHALGRIMVFLSLYSTDTQISLCMSVVQHDKTEFHRVANHGWFSFLGKLKHSCNPNTLSVGLNKQVALVAMQPIKCGAELTMSYVSHWLDSSASKVTRQRSMFMLYGVVCNCIFCTEHHKQNNNYNLSVVQSKAFQRLNIEEMKARFNPRSIPDIFPKLCKTLAFLSDLPFAEEYEQVYIVLRKCILFLQDLATENIILDYA